MSVDKTVKGLRRLTKANSKPVRLLKGGKTYTADTSKKRKYTVPGESK